MNKISINARKGSAGALFSTVASIIAVLVVRKLGDTIPADVATETTVAITGALTGLFYAAANFIKHAVNK